MKFNRKM